MVYAIMDEIWFQFTNREKEKNTHTKDVHFRYHVFGSAYFDDSI